MVGCGHIRKTNREPQIRDLLSDSLRSPESARSQSFALLSDSGLQPSLESALRARKMDLSIRGLFFLLSLP